jgi:hypothetical protein
MKTAMKPVEIVLKKRGGRGRRLMEDVNLITASTDVNVMNLLYN